MRGKAYAVVNRKDVVEIALSRRNAQEILMDYALEHGHEVYNWFRTRFEHEDAMREAQFAVNEWQIWEYNLV